MQARAPSGDPEAGRLDSLWVGFGTLVFHAAVALGVPAPGDFGKYSNAARLLLEGELPAARLHDFSFLYLRLSAAAESLAGLLPASGADLVVGLQIGLAAGLVAGVHHLCRRLGRLPALFAAGILATDPRLLVYERITEPEVLLLSLLVGSWILVETRPSGRRPALLASAGAGLLAFAAVATRPTFLPLFLLVPLYYRACRSWPDCVPASGPRPFAGWRRLSLAFLAPLILGLLLLGAWRQSHGPAMNPGTVFFEGNHPLSLGTTAIYPPLVASMSRTGGVESPSPDPAHVHYRSTGRFGRPAADAAEVNALWADRARAFLLDHPEESARRFLAKVGHAFHGFGWHDITIASAYELRLPVPHLPTAALAALALVGLLAETRRWPRALPFYALLFSQLGVMLVFYVSERQRMVLLPAWAYFAAAALRWWLPPWPPDDRGRRLGALALVGLLAVTFSLPSDAMRDEDYRRRGLARQMNAAGDAVEVVAMTPWRIDEMRPPGMPLEPAGLDERVARFLAASLEDGTASAPLRFDLAAILLDLGLRGDAHRDAGRWLLEPLVEGGFRAYRGGRGPSDPRILLARLEALADRLDVALELLEAVQREYPGDAFALAERAAICHGSGRSGEAEEAVSLLDRYWGEADRRWLLGRALLAHGLAAEAVVELEPLSRHLPQHRELRLRLALALGESGEIDRAADEILAANRLAASPVIEPRRMASIARRWAAAHPDDSRVQNLAERIVEQHGLALSGPPSSRPDGELRPPAAPDPK